MNTKELVLNTLVVSLYLGILAILFYWVGHFTGSTLITDNVIAFFLGIWFVFCLGLVGPYIDKGDC